MPLFWAGGYTSPMHLVSPRGNDGVTAAVDFPARRKCDAISEEVEILELLPPYAAHDFTHEVLVEPHSVVHRFAVSKISLASAIACRYCAGDSLCAFATAWCACTGCTE